MRLILYLQSWGFSVILAVYSSKINFVSAKTSHKSENDKLDNDKSDNAHAMPPKVQLATNRLVRYAFFVLGGFFALLALIGVILPGLPTPPLEIDTKMVDVNAIVQADIPEDPALIKEEIDRLSDKDARLSEQTKLINEQLGVIEELTSAKQEQIALLEAQIAQLEAQKQGQ